MSKKQRKSSKTKVYEYYKERMDREDFVYDTKIMSYIGAYEGLQELIDEENRYLAEEKDKSL